MRTKVHYTVLIRLPFARGDFVDPPPADWDSTKDQQLWNILSEASAKGRELDWTALANRFGVTLAFLSQQAAWLYEKQLSQVRAQLRNVNKPSSTGNSPTPGSNSGIVNAVNQSGLRVTSGGARLPSSVSQRQSERRVSYGEDGADSPRQSRGYPLSRNASTATVTLARDKPLLVRPSTETIRSLVQRRQSRETSVRPAEASPKQRRPSFETAAGPSAVLSDSSNSSSSESEALHPMLRSRAFARKPRYPSAQVPSKALSDAEEEEEDQPHFLPFSDVRTELPPQTESRDDAMKDSSAKPPSHRPAAGPSKTNKPGTPSKKQTAHSSSSSAQSQPKSQRPTSHQALSALSPRQRRIAKEGSDGSPSMGSSFSDLDDASITQSALEDALANEMAHGGVASKMSTISQALKSRYL